MHVHKNVGSVAGRFGLRVEKDGIPVEGKTVGPCNNVITEYFIRDFLFSGNDFRYFGGEIAVGQGSSELTKTSTGLGNRTAYVSHSVSITIGDNGNGTVTVTWDCKGGFSIGDFNGDTLTEVGLIDEFNNQLHAGQLIKDEQGDPTTVTVLSDEQLVAEYQISATIPHGFVEMGSGTVTVKGQDVGYTIYKASLEDPLANLGKDTHFVYSNVDEHEVVDSGGSRIHDAETGNNDLTRSISGSERTVTFSYQWAPSDFSSSDIKRINAGYIYGGNDIEYEVYIEFDTPLEKTDQEAFDLTFSATESYSQA